MWLDMTRILLEEDTQRLNTDDAGTETQNHGVHKASRKFDVDNVCIMEVLITVTQL
jgi:hypothetical protein